MHKRGGRAKSPVITSSSPTRVSATPPISLLLKQQAILLGTHQAGKTVMCLLEQVTSTVSELLDITRHSDEHIARGAANLLTTTKLCAGPLVFFFGSTAAAEL